MKTALDRFWEVYRKGIRWLTVDPQEELFLQLIYIGMVITEVSLLWIFGYEHVITFTFMMVAYLFILYFFSWKKDCWEGSILQGSHKEEYYFNAYWVLTVLLVGITTGTCSFLMIPLMIAPFAGTFLIYVLWSVVIELLSVAESTHTFVFYHKYHVICSVAFYVVDLLPVVLSVAFLPIFWIWKVLIVGAYILLAPLIVVGADNGMDFTQMFSVMR